jgi:hypothetical protein
MDGRVIEAIFRWQPGEPATDYDRACDVDGSAALLAVGDGLAIVLGNEGPLPVTWQPLETGGLLLAQLYTTETGDFPRELPKLPNDLSWEPVGEFATDGSPLRLFDSTEPGDQDPVFPSIPVQLAAGRYVVESTKLEDAQMEVWLVRLRQSL